MHFSRARLRPAVLVGLLGLTTSTIALCLVYDRFDNDPMPQGPIELTPGAAAMRASIDPETGTLVQEYVPASKADSPELQNMLSQSTEGLVEVHHPDGTVSVNLQGRFHSASVARIDSSGKLHTTCVDNAAAAHACLSEHTAPQAAEVR